MKYKKGKGFPYKTPLNRHMQGHDPLTENIRDTSDLSDEQVAALREKYDEADYSERKSEKIGPVEGREAMEKKLYDYLDLRDSKENLYGFKPEEEHTQETKDAKAILDEAEAYEKRKFK